MGLILLEEFLETNKEIIIEGKLFLPMEDLTFL
jgi:hypothetical protein